jgi:hypothetical protein
MPSIEKKEKSSLTGALDDVVERRRKDKYVAATNSDEFNPDFLNILEFVDRFNLLPAGLYPVQKFILKLYYNIPLNDTLPENETDRIKISPTFRKKDSFFLTEVEYLAYLHKHGRCNIGVQDDHPRRELILVLGRRSGKSVLAGLISAYELYKLIRRGCPQAYYGMIPTSEIRVFCIANDKDQASIVYGEMSGHIAQVDYFRESLIHDTQTYIKFRTESDKKRFKDKSKGTITATFKSSIARGLRGRGIICCVLDEFAFFIDDGKSSAEKVYKAISPALKQFSPRDHKDRRRSLGPSEGRMISISSPDAREGLFYKLYEMSLSNTPASANMLMIQAPTWEVNPTIDESEYVVERAKSPRDFETEYGAQFSDRVRGWIESSQDLFDCIIPDLKPLQRGLPREPYFCGLDFALAGDGTCVALTRINNGKVELGYHETYRAKTSWKDLNPHLLAPSTPYAHGLKDITRLDLDEVVNWLVALSKRFYIVRGYFDQWAGIIFEQKLHKAGLTQLEMKNFTPSQSSEIFQVTKMLMYSKQLALYDYPIPERTLEVGSRDHSPHIQEMLELQATSGGKNIVIVEAPNIVGKHDDFSDAYARSNFVASEYIRENPGILDVGLINQPVRQQPVNYFQAQRAKIRLHGPPPRERRVPASNKWR